MSNADSGTPSFTDIPLCCPVCGDRRVMHFCNAVDGDQSDLSWQIWKCEKCEYGWTWPLLPAHELSRYYPTSYLGDTEKMLREFSQGSLQQHRSWRRETEKVDLVEHYRSQGRILDIGASNASFLLALDGEKWVRCGVEFIGDVVDLVSRHHPELDLRAGDIHTADLPLSSYDVITFWHVFEHLPEPGKVLQRARELLRPGGLVVISVPNFASLQSHLFRSHWYSFDVPRHLHHFSPQSLEILFQQSGFRVQEHLFFSRRYNFHQLKHSLLSWSKQRLSSRVPYYLLKPSLFLFQAGESFSSRYGALTTVAELEG